MDSPAERGIQNGDVTYLTLEYGTQGGLRARVNSDLEGWLGKAAGGNWSVWEAGALRWDAGAGFV